jgi:hypothetical protein
MIDTGASGSFYLPDDLFATAKRDKPFAKSIFVRSTAFQTVVDSCKIIKIPFFDIGGKLMAENNWVLSNNKQKPIIGLDFLKNYKVTLDWKYQEITFSDRNSAQNPCYIYGFNALPIDGKITVSSILQPSPAYDLGLRFGDKILKINDLETKNWTDKTLCETDFFKNRNEPITLQIQRADKFFDLRLLPITCDEIFK